MTETWEWKPVKPPAIPDAFYDIREFGAIEGGEHSCRQAIQAAIDRAWQEGGGHVVIPPGIWLTGPIELKTRIDLHLEENSLLLFHKTKEDYPLLVTEYEGRRRIRATSPVWARDASHISITGGGIIDGSGEKWRMAKEFKFSPADWQRLTMKSRHTLSMTKEGSVWFPSRTAYEGFLKGEEEICGAAPVGAGEESRAMHEREVQQLDNEKQALGRAAAFYDFYRPVMVSLIRCRHVLIEGVTLQNSPAWNLHPLYCEDVIIRNARIRNDPWAQNGDGLDLESCRRVEVSHVEFDVGDDAICMKSGKNAPARSIDFPTEQVYIHDCQVLRAHGGFSVGSEMSRGVRNILVERCTFVGTDTGIRFKTALGRGGVVEDITIRDIHMLRIRDEAIVMTMGYVLSQAQSSFVGEGICTGPDDIPEFRRIHMERIRCLDAGTAIRMEGIREQKIHDISFQDVYLQAQDPGKLIYVEDISFASVRICDTARKKVYTDHEIFGALQELLLFEKS